MLQVCIGSAKGLAVEAAAPCSAQTKMASEGSAKDKSEHAKKLSTF